MPEYIYASAGEPLANESGKIFLARARIVRCRDCEFEMNGYCSRPDEWKDNLWFPIEPNGFCIWGERK